MPYIGNVSGFDTVDTEQIKDGSVTAAKVSADVATQSELDAVSAVANAALPKSGGALTGAVTTNSTIDGRDVAADGVLATNALPKSGGTMTGNIATKGISSVTLGTGNFVAGDTAGTSTLKYTFAFWHGPRSVASTAART